MLNMIGWWYIVDGKRQGPVTLATLEKLLQHRILGAQSLVWREGMPQWTPLAAMDELKPLLNSPPPLLPAAPHKTSVTHPRAARRGVTVVLSACLLIAAGAFVYLATSAYLPGWGVYLRQKVTLPLLIPRSQQPHDGITMAAEHLWRNPITQVPANIGSGWTIKQLAADPTTLASSFTSDDIVVNLSVVKNQNQTLVQLVVYLKTSEPSLRFINTGTYSHTSVLSNWTGIATSRADHARHYVVHVTNAQGGYGIFIAAVNQQTAASFSRLEALIAELDRTFSGH
ncbi:DUF4339 domain-containing protein [Sodalis sp. RH15]|uniref:DUF4339 domain-containing protein n=1 Tax=Sodalis sp. RH15 TaxID=3394330 RepID=UPI0039B69F10